MNHKINQCQIRLFTKLFTTLPSVKKADEFNNKSNLNFKIDNLYFFKNKDFWFSKSENEDKYIYLFGIKDKHIKHVCGNDTCLIIDFDKNIQFNNSCLGFFSIKNSEIHILINSKLLNERYPYIDVHNFKRSRFKSTDDSIDVEIIDLGNLNIDFIDNLENLINAASVIKSQNDATSQIIKNSPDCKICSKKKDNSKIDSNLKNLKPELCGRCIEKIVVSEFYSKIIHLLKENRTEELKVVKEKFGNDQVFDIGLKLLEKYNIIRYIGVKKLFYTIDKDSYLVKKYLKYSDENNLLIDQINKNNESKSNKLNKERQVEKIIANTDSQNLKTKKQMDSVIGAIADGKSRKEAAMLANVPLYKIDQWYDGGKQGNSPENIYFFSQLREIENSNKKQTNALENKMKQTLEELKNGNDISQLDFISEKELNEWIRLGKQNKFPYSHFYEECIALFENQIEEYKNNEINRKIFLENLKFGKTKEESAKNANVELSLVNSWYLKGSENKKPFVEFYNDYLEIENIKKPQIPKLTKTGSFENQRTISAMNIVIEDLANGKSEDEAIEHANVSKDTYNYWINRGKQDFGDLYIQFYKYVLEFKSIPDEPSIGIDDNHVEESNLVNNGIFEPLIKEYEELFNSMNQTGIAWVDKIGSNWTYSRDINGKIINLSAETIPKLYEKVIGQDLIWGIIDYDRAKKVMDFPDDFEIPLVIQVEDFGSDIFDSNIYAPLPKKYEDSFNSMNQSGIAWVNKTGSKWTYSRNIDGKVIRLSNNNIYDLYNEVKKENQIWGVRDYNRAKKIIDIPDDFEIPLEDQVEEFDNNLVDEVDSTIYAPLPEEYEKSFNSMNQTGIAWVNQIGNKFYYVKSVNGKNVRLSGNNIYSLYNEVKKENQIWGVRDYDKARKFIDIPDDFEILEKRKNESNEINEDNEINKSIYVPLSKDQLSKFNPNQNNKTGIAWVNRVGKNWCYQRQRNGKTIRIIDSDIIKLHKKVIANNQIWGIIDINKAIKVIGTNPIGDNQDIKPPKTIKPIITSDVKVNCLEVSNKFEILIKGTIKNMDLFDVLMRFELFKENIKRIITNSMNKETDIFIELELDKSLLNLFEGKIEDFGWEINK